jgi:hypothetical protein
MSRQLWRVAVLFVAGAIVTLATTSVWAWTQETVTPNGNYNFNYGPLNDKNKSGDSANKSDPNSPGFHFGVQQGDSAGFHNFGGFSGNRNATPSQPYFRTFGN